MKQQWLGYLIACVTLAVASLAASASETIGHAEVSFSGGVEEQFSGSAMYLTQELPTGDRLVLTLYRYESDDDLTAISMVFPADTAKAGSYEVREDVRESDITTAMMRMSDGSMYIGGPVSGEAVFVDGRLDLQANAVAGELVIETVSGNQMTGTLMFKGEMIKLGDTENQVKFDLEATFEAVAGKAEDCLGCLVSRHWAINSVAPRRNFWPAQ